MSNHSNAYAIYLRKSRKDLEAETRGEGETLKRHLQMLTELADKQQLPVERVYAEIVSGESIEDRPQIKELLKDVEHGCYRGVLVAEIERLARGDTSDQGRVARAFQLSHTKIITPMRTYDPDNEFDEEYFEFGLFMSRREYKTIRRRLLAGAKASCREGKYTGSIAPYGYTRYKLPSEKGWSLTPQKEQANVVQRIFHWYLYGIDGATAGYGKIAEELNRLKIPSPSGTIWTPNSIQNILRNPVYAGYIKDGYRKKVKKFIDGELIESRPLNHNCILSSGRHTPIISEDTWQSVRTLQIHRQHDSSTQKHPPKNPLSGLIRCSCCGRIMQRKATQNHTEIALLCTTKGCSTVSSPLIIVEQRILEAIEHYLSSTLLPPPVLPSSTSEKIIFLENALIACQKELQKVTLQLQHQYELLEQGLYTKELFLSRRETTLLKQESLNTRLLHLTEEFQKEKQQYTLPKDLLSTPYTFSSIYQTITSPSTKNILLKQLIDYVIYTKSPDSRGCPDGFTLEIFFLTTHL